MGGRISLLVAGRLPDRVAAAASFHGGGLATDTPDSPHLLADRMSAMVYVGGAENDASFTADHAEQLDKALTAAGVGTPSSGIRPAMGLRSRTMRPTTPPPPSGIGRP